MNFGRIPVNQGKVQEAVTAQKWVIEIEPAMRQLARTSAPCRAC